MSLIVCNNYTGPNQKYFQKLDKINKMEIQTNIVLSSYKIRS